MQYNVILKYHISSVCSCVHIHRCIMNPVLILYRMYWSTLVFREDYTCGQSVDQGRNLKRPKEILVLALSLMTIFSHHFCGINFLSKGSGHALFSTGLLLLFSSPCPLHNYIALHLWSLATTLIFPVLFTPSPLFPACPMLGHWHGSLFCGC